MTDLLTRATADISLCGKYRYRLERMWGDAHALPFVMLNPSTADASQDDPTIRRCMRFARDRGYGGVIVMNLFAYRATSPESMKEQSHPVGVETDSKMNDLFRWAKRADVPVVCAWGTHGIHQARDKMVLSYARLADVNTVCLGATKHGHPRHPLYVKADQPFEAFPAQAMEARRAETTGSVHDSAVPQECVQTGAKP